MFPVRGVSLRTWLAFLIALTVIGAAVIAALAGWYSWQGQRKRLGLNLLANSRSIIAASDRELDQAVALGRALAVSPYLTQDDMGGFDAQARQALSAYGYTLILNPADVGRQLINTQLPFGTPLANRAIDADWIEPSVRTAGVGIKPLHRSLISQEWVVIVQVPAIDAVGKIRYVVNIVIPARIFQNVIAAQRLPDHWNPVIFDNTQTIVARGVKATEYVGQKGHAALFQLSPRLDNISASIGLEGLTMFSARSRSARYGWTVAVGLPEALMTRQFLEPVAFASLSGFAIAMLVIGAVAFFATRLINGIRALTEEADVLGRGEAVVVPRFPVRELAAVSERMESAAARLRENNRVLETRVAAATQDLRREAEERRKVEAALAEAQRIESLGQVTGGVAHDFNNLLTVISGNLEMIERRASGDDIKRFANAARRGAERGAQLVQSLLAFARKQPLRPVTVNPNWLIKEFAPVLKGAAGDAIQLQLLLNPTVHPCRIDAAQFQSALLNLVANAAGAMTGGGQIAIETENFEAPSSGSGKELKPGSYIRIKVSDTGSGMSPEVVIRAFEPFFTTKDIGKGSGLGLSQVYGFAKQSGGHAELSSEPGIGTVVTFYLPRSVEAAAEETTSSRAVTTRALQPSARVMVVDDDGDVRNALVQALVDLGYAVVAAKDGPDALAKLDACRAETGERIDLVLTDYSMPNGMTGRELAQRIALIEPAIKLVLISGHAGAMGNTDLGDIAWLSKPVSQADLDRAIKRALG
jgi:signal transduction histidine kinase/CheY-like chemotaxis protein